MNNLQLFNFEGNEVRTLKIDDEPYFVGKDVTKILGYKNSSKALSDHVDEEDKLNNETLSSLGQRGGWLVNESGLYSLILSSKMPNAKRFKHWVTSEVLPAIRKHGAYMTDQKAFNVVNNKDGLADLLQQAADQLKEKDIKIEEVEAKNKNLTIQLEESNKKASYLDVILGTPDLLATTQIAADYGYSAMAFNKLLKSVGIQHKVNGQWILYKAYMGKGYVASKAFTFQDHRGRDRSRTTTYWTQAGRKLIYDVLKDNDILPLIERDDIAQEVTKMNIDEQIKSWVVFLTQKEMDRYKKEWDREKKEKLKSIHEKKYLNAENAAKYLDMSRTSFWKWRKDNHVKCYRLGDNMVRFKKSDLDEIAQSKEVS